MSALERFSKAIEQNHSNVIQCMLSSGELDANARVSNFNRPVLVQAACENDSRVVELLLMAGARINDVDNMGFSACHAAASWGNLEEMRMLLAHQPDLTLKISSGDSVLQRAIFALNNNKEAAVLQLLHAGASLDALNRDALCALAAINTAIIQLMMDHNIVFSELRDSLGQTPLHLAVLNRHDLLSMLIDCGVDVEARDNVRKTCTEIAVAYGYVNALRPLLQAGADVNSADDAAPLLHTSVTSRDSEFKFTCMMLLLAAGADVAARDDQGRTACHLAVARPAPMMSFVHAMVAAGADLDAEDRNGRTPRQCLAERRPTRRVSVDVDPEQVEMARREIAKVRLDFVRHRAMEVCIGLQSLRLDALQMCEILQLVCGPLARLIAFHQWWEIVTTVKHFKR